MFFNTFHKYEFNAVARDMHFGRFSVLEIGLLVFYIIDLSCDLLEIGSLLEIDLILELNVMTFLLLVEF